MSGFSFFERKVARTLGRFPVVKDAIKIIYSRLTYFLRRKAYRSKCAHQCFTYSYKEQDSFFGYYDHSPMNGLGLTLVCLSSASTSEKPKQNERITLAVFDDNLNVVCRLDVKAFNWQQGCRAGWLDDDLFIFNDFDVDGNKYVSRVYSASQNVLVASFDYPVQDYYKNEFFISLNYRRLAALRPDYGYRNLPALDNYDIRNLGEDGLWRIDFRSGKAQLIISLAEICSFNFIPAFEEAFHKVNHVMIAPDGKCFLFMHRYLIGKRRCDRLFLADSASGKMRLLSDFGMVSHCFWVDHTTVLGYMRGPGGRDGYWLVDTSTGDFTRPPLDALMNFGDGHPHVHGDWFVTDTYPDKARMQHLLLGNWRTGEVREIGQFFHGFEYSGESRCDLHPRFSPDGKAVFFDSVYTGKRQLYRMDLT